MRIRSRGQKLVFDNILALFVIQVVWINTCRVYTLLEVSLTLPRVRVLVYQLTSSLELRLGYFKRIPLPSSWIRLLGLKASWFINTLYIAYLKIQRNRILRLLCNHNSISEGLLNGLFSLFSLWLYFSINLRIVVNRM